jgi:hypothetical protein
MGGGDFLRQQLANYFTEMRSKNPAYSLRAMARSFRTSPAQLSQIIANKRPMTNKFILKVSEKLGLSPLEVKSILEFHSGVPAAKTAFETIDDDNFKLVADWYHFAILSLSKVRDCEADPKWIAKRLGIDYFVAREAFHRLRKLGLIEIANGKYRQISRPLHTTNDVPSNAIRKYHSQNLELAKVKLDEVDIEAREFSTITFAVNLKNLPTAKKMIRKFKTEIYELLETGKKEEVYTMAIQLFPVSKNKQGEK